MKVAAHLCSSIVFFPHSHHPTEQCHPLELLMCHWFGIGAGFSFVFLLLLDDCLLQVGDETTDQFISDLWLGAGGWS